MEKNEWKAYPTMQTWQNYSPIEGRSDELFVTTTLVENNENVHSPNLGNYVIYIEKKD